MNQPPNPFNSNQQNPLDPLQQDQSEFNRENEQLPKAYHPATKKTLQKLFLFLIIIGIAIGGVLSVGVIALMQKAGLTNVPARVDNPK
jgi:amino acid permease